MTNLEGFRLTVTGMEDNVSVTLGVNDKDRQVSEATQLATISLLGIRAVAWAISAAIRENKEKTIAEKASFMKQQVTSIMGILVDNILELSDFSEADLLAIKASVSKIDTEKELWGKESDKKEDILKIVHSIIDLKAKKE